jgi:hypothetical protein
MARKSLRPQLNQIRAWVRQGRTDAWIAHQLEIPAAQLRDFIDKNGLSGEGDDPAGDVDLRDEIEAEIEAELDAVEEEPDEPEEEEGATDEDSGDRPRGDDGDGDGAGSAGRKRRRRGGRGGRGRRRRGPRSLEATFDHGDSDGYGLWLDPSVKDNNVYTEHWAGHRALKVTIEPERIVLERVGDDSED